MNATPSLRLISDSADAPDGAEFIRPLPHNIKAEQHVLGSVMLSAGALGEVRALLDGSEFYRPAHAQIWDGIVALADRGAPCDPVAVAAAIGPRDLSKLGGAPYLHTLISQVPTTANAAFYAHMIRDLAYARKVVTTGTRLAQLGYSSSGDDIAELRAAVATEVTTVTAPDTRGWPAPAPLWGGASDDLPAFPVWCFPGWLSDYVSALAEATQTPADLAGSLALAVLAVAASGKVWVRGTTWTEPTNLYTVVVLPPGNRKSEVYKAMTAPLKAAESDLIRAAAPLIAEAKLARKVAEADAEKTERAAVAATDELLRAERLADAQDAALRLDETVIPAEPRLFTANATVEKLTSMLAEQGGRFAILAPEGKIFSILAGRYSGSPDLEVFLSGHAGEEMRTNRMGREGEDIAAATLTLGVCIQPGVLARLGETPEFREQGFLARLLCSVPKSLLGFRRADPDPVPPAVLDTYTGNVKALVLSLAALEEPRTLRFTPEAEAAIIALLCDTEERFRPGGDLAHMPDWGGKLVGAILRIAALLHLAEHLRTGWDCPITLATFTNAHQIGEYFTQHAQAAYDTIGADPAVADARALLEWIRRTGTERFTARDVVQALRSRFAKVTDTDPGLRVLESHGWIRRLPAPPRKGAGRTPSVAYEAHPDAPDAHAGDAQ